MITRRALLLGAGGAALVAGCGPPDTPAVKPAEGLSEPLRLTRLAVAAYAGVHAPAAEASARARAAKLAAAVRAAGGTPGPAPSGPAGAQAAYDAETRALASYVAAIGQLADRRSRTLLAGLVPGAAQAQAALAPRVGKDPLATAFPGEPAS